MAHALLLFANNDGAPLVFSIVAVRD